MMISSHKWLFLLAILCTVVLSGCKDKDPNTIGPGNKGPENNPSVVKKSLTKDDFLQALILKNRGIGHLENKEWADAEKSLSALAELLPQNLLAVRNLAVARVLVLIDRESPYQQSGSAENAKTFATAVKAAEQAIGNLAKLAGTDYDKALSEMLQGRLLIHADSSENPTFEDGLKHLQAAADTLPEAADFRFAVAMAMDGNRNYTDANLPQSAELLKTLQKSFQLAPENLFALQKLMQRQALSLNSKNDATKQLALQIVDTLKSAQPLLAPLNESIKKQRGMDLIVTIGKALGKFDGVDVTPLMGPAMMMGNLLLPEVATQIDQRRLSKNLLEYILLDFDDEFLAAAHQTSAMPEPEPTVVKAFVATGGLPRITGVTRVELQDMNLDGFDDLVVAREGKIEVYSRGTDLQAEWALLMTSPESSVDATSFLLADIDRDFDKALSDVKSASVLRDADGDQKIPQDPAGKNRWYDTDLDVIAWSNDGVVIFRNEVSDDKTRSMIIVPQAEEIPGINDIVAADLEADGDLDLIFGTDTGMTLWKNIDGTMFENMNASASLPKRRIHSLAIVDWNSDVGIDVIGVDESGNVGCLENMLHGRFRWSEDALSLSRRWSVVLAGAGPQPGSSGGGIQPRAVRVIASRKRSSDLAGDTLGELPSVGDHEVVGDSPHLADLDNDGRMDILFRSETGGIIGFRPNAEIGNSEFKGLEDAGTVRAFCTSDVDDDGDLDVVYASAADGTIGLLTNDGGNTNNWIDVVVRAVPNDPQFPSNRVNMHSIGSVIELRAGGLYHGEVITQPKVHLGLGKATAVDAIRILWTDGIPQNVTVPNLLRPRIGILAPQILKGSCPYIYTWTGERFEFFSDCLWAAPIGLVQANGEIAPTREWENLLIPGEALVEKDGQYLVQLTEELWETAYFDQVQLTAIDHPADVSIFTNEKVGPPHMATHRVHTVKNARQPASVVDGGGRDLLPGLAAQDGDYVQPFNGRIMQGLTDDWAMEFDLGELTQPKNVRLFLLGWVFPTDTSLNLGIEQNPNVAPPAGPSIEVPDGQGGWKVARPFVGFPSGKTKAMVVDISDIFEGDDYRFRIRSSMELYWDRAFFTVDEEDAETHSQTCPLEASDLHYRGFSRRTYADNALFRNGHAPEGYDYQSVTTDPRWPPISGRFTRYGNTTPLLHDHDDQMVVMGPGDELTLSFAVPVTPVTAGWKRDFVLMNVGYDKDADLNTIYGQSSEPFPFQAMTRYPFAPEDQVPDSPAYNGYINEWQTREYSAKPFWDALKR
jgi:hypothetical protein